MNYQVKWKPAIVIAVAGIMIYSIIWVNTDFPETRKPSKKQPTSSSLGFQQIIKSYHRQHVVHQDRHLLTIPQEEVDVIASFVEFRNQVNLVVKKYGKATPLTTRISNSFKGFEILMMFNQRGIIPQALGSWQYNGEKKLTIVLVPQSQATNDPANFFYSHAKTGQGIIVRAIKWKTPLFAARFLHEMGHAVKDQIDHAPSATAEIMSDSWILEEMEMYALELKILMIASNGKFLKLLDGIIDRCPASDVAENHYDAVYNSVTLSDLQSYDKLFGIEDAGKISTATYLGQFILALGTRTVERRNEFDRQNAQIKFFRWYRSMKNK